MEAQNTLIDLLDSYARKALTQEDVTAIEERMVNDKNFRELVEKHTALTEALKLFGSRKQLKQLLEVAHEEMIAEPLETKVVPITGWKKYWPLTAVAASVAMISVVGTFWYTHTTNSEQTAAYKELRRNVEQIKKSQRIMMADIAEAKKNGKPVPGNYAGTGFMISGNGYVATSYHVVKGADSVMLENERFGLLRATIVHSDPDNDISILRIDSMRENVVLPFTISKAEANLADDVFTLGFPREDVVYGEGAVSALSGYEQNPNAYQVSVPVNPGNSGGPLLNSKGDLIGIISGIQTRTAGAAFAIKSTIINDVIANDVLDTLHNPINLPKQNTIKNNNRVQQVKRWKDFVFVVQVYKGQE